MRSRKRLAPIVLVVALLVPYAAMAGQAPSAQVTNPQSGDPDGITGLMDVRGRTAYGGLLFWYQYFMLARWFSHWGIAF